MARTAKPKTPEQIAFSRRLLRAAESAGGKAKLAKDAGFSDVQTLQNYTVRGTEPRRPHLVALARAGGVTVDWLATGEASINEGLLFLIISELEEWLEDENPENPPTPSEKARFVIETYRDLASVFKTPDRQKVLAFVRKLK